FKPAANANGSATVTVLAKDDGGTANGGVDTSTPQTFTITVLATTTTTVTASPTPSVYGQAGTFTATVSGATPTGSVTFYDTFNGTTTSLGSGMLDGSGMATWTVPSTSPLAAGSHSITAVYGGDSANGTSTSSALTQSVTPASLTVTVDQDPSTAAQDAFSRIYGDADPTFSVRYTGFVNGETTSVLGGTLTYSTNETQTSGAGTYTILASGLTSSNYAITYVSGSLNVTKRAVTVTADAQSKTYGDADPALTYHITSGSLVNGDSFSGSLTRDAGEDVGSYAITQGTLALSSNYSLSYEAGASLTVSARSVTVTADAQSKTYGDADPALTYHITSGSLVNGDAFSGALTRDAGENVGNHAITQGTLALSSNYDLSYAGASLTVNARAVTVTADAQSKTYGDADPAL